MKKQLSQDPFDFLNNESQINIDSATLTATNAFMEIIKKKYPTDGAILFGSRARQTHQNDSDADVLVLLRGPKEVDMETKFTMADIAFDILMNTGVLITPVPILIESWMHPENYSNPSLLRNIRNEGVRL